MKRSLILTLLFSLFIGQSALAHDSLIGQFPAEGQSLEAGVIEIRLDFSDEVLAIQGSSATEIIISGPNGQETIRNNGCALVEGQTAIARVELVESGSYQVAWRTVSNDGHPISGSYSFNIENSTGYQAQGFEEIQCENPVGDNVDLAKQNQNSINYLLLWISLPLLALGILILFWPKNKSRKK